MVQQNIGMRSRVMPGARIRKIVTRKLMAPKMELMPSTTRPRSSRSTPVSGSIAESGAYIVQPVGRAAEGEGADDEDGAGHEHPEGQRVDAREGHVRGADLERHDVVREARRHGHHEQEDHHHGVHAEELVVGGLVDELEARAPPAPCG